MIVGGTIAAILCVVTAALAVLLLSKLYIKRRQRKRINDIARYSDFICYPFLYHSLQTDQKIFLLDEKTLLQLKTYMVS